MKGNVGRISAFENLLNGIKEFDLVAFCDHGIMSVTAQWRVMALRKRRTVLYNSTNSWIQI